MSSKSPTDIVQAFMREWPKGIDALRQSFNDFLAEDVRYENVGLTSTTTRADAVALIETFAPGLDSIGIDMLAIAHDGQHVFTERVDYLRAANGETLSTIRLMGIFVVRGDRISEWRDYFFVEPAKDGKPTSV